MTPAWRVRAGAVTLALPLLITLCLPGTTTAQVAARQQAPPGGSSGASVVKTGWWWRVNEAPTGQVPVAPPQAAPPTVPAGALPAAAAAGEPEKVAAIEFALDASPGATVSSFVVTLRESSAPGTNVGNDRAKVVACPITEPWMSGQALRTWSPAARSISSSWWSSHSLIGVLISSTDFRGKPNQATISSIQSESFESWVYSRICSLMC